MANIFYQKLKCLLSVASNIYLIKLILQLHMVIKKQSPPWFCKNTVTASLLLHSIS